MFSRLLMSHSMLKEDGRQGCGPVGCCEYIVSVCIIVSVYWGKVKEPLREGPPLSKGTSHSLCVDSLTLTGKSE